MWKKIEKENLADVAEKIESIPQEIKKQIDTNILNAMWDAYQHLMAESEEADDMQ